MNNFNKDGEGRRDYGQSSEKRYSSEGRVLRPRRSAGNDGERRSYGERKSYGEGGERRSYGSHTRSYGEHRSYGEGGERRSYGERRSNFSGNGEGRSYGERNSYNGGERRNYGEHKSFGHNDRGGFSGNGEGRSYGERRSYNGGERRSYGEHKSYGEGGEHRSSYGERRSYNGGERRSFGDRKPGFGGERRSFGDRKPGFGGGRGGRRPFRKEEYFNEAEGSGIDRMISRKPLVSDMQNSDFDYAAPMTKDEMRLNKFIANSGVCSRREADTFIMAGVVTVNGEVVTELGTKVNVINDDVRFNGERLKGEEKVYIVMNKPKGFATTASDPHADRTVMDLLKGCDRRVFPVGRLDKATTGVLMFTNDGEIAEKLTHPSFDKKKIYQVILDHEVSQEDHDKILAGLTLSDGEIKADELEFIDENDHRKMGIEIHSGKNRIVRRIFESLGYDVRALDRVYFAGLTKKGLQKGEWRYLTEGEVNILKMGAYV
ncbi:MAG: pseudouridine synthase [Bacteroidales bacterium]|nr:pseudouridine synthase [Bacteroidales bacterium]